MPVIFIMFKTRKMKITIEMGTDLATATDARIILTSQSHKQYELKASAETYGNRMAAGRNIPLMSLNAETKGKVKPEDGMFTVFAKCDMGHYQLESMPEKIMIK